MSATQSKQSFWISISDLSRFLERQPSEVKDLLSEGKRTQFVGTSVSPGRARELLIKLGYQYQPQIISFQMLKGGVAKTTSALNLGIRAAMYGARVLFVDLDQQANLTFALGCETEGPVWIDLIDKKAKVQNLVCAIEDHVDLIPSNLNNSGIEKALFNSNRNWSKIVKAPLDEIKDNYDLIIIDTAPALSALNTAVCVATDKIILPINPDRFSMMGLEKNIQELEEIKKDFELNFEMQILMTKFDSREKMSHEILENCIEKYSDKLMNHFIRTSTEVKNSIGSTKNLFQNKSPIKEDFDQATLEMLNWQTDSSQEA